MAEFCLDCWNKLNGTKEPAWKDVLSDELELCEACNRMKQVIVMRRGAYLASILRWPFDWLRGDRA